MQPTTSACGASIAYGKVVCAHLTDFGSSLAGRWLLQLLLQLDEFLLFLEESNPRRDSQAQTLGKLGRVQLVRLQLGSLRNKNTITLN